MLQNDILKEIEDTNTISQENNNEEINFHYEVIVTENKKRSSLKSSLIFFGKYVTTTSLIFFVLLLCTNYSAYYSMIKSRVMKGQAEEVKQSLINSVEAAMVSNTNTMEEESITVDKEEQLAIKKLKKELDANKINLDIDITTLENRIIIPKIGKNIPLIEIKNRQISGQNELNEIFMKELENGVIRYPGSAKPGEDGLSFVFGHSSNFPWLDGEYNDVFATLDRVMIGDEIIVYFNQQKYVFKVRTRDIIKPGDVGILKRNLDKPEIAIMTCWPIGTTLNRFIVIGELVE